MNREYILNKIKPYLNSNNILSEDDFNTLFSTLSKSQQYKIINILIEENIEIDYDYVVIETPKIIQRPASVTPDTSKMGKLSNEQLCVIYQQGNQIALEILVIKNTKLVWSRVIKYAKRYKHKLDEEDIAQYGTMGLIKAAEKFELSKETKFTTYAIWWIDQHILRGIVDYGFTIRIPVHMFEQMNRLLRVFAQNPGFTKQEIFELAKEGGMSREKFEELLMIIDNVISLTSLNSLIGEDEDSELGNFYVDHESPSVEEQVEYTLSKEAIAEVLTTLPIREQDVIEQRFGLKDGIVRTLEQVGIKYNVTRERIRQIEAKALRKLKHPSRSKALKNLLWR